MKQPTIVIGLLCGLIATSAPLLASDQPPPRDLPTAEREAHRALPLPKAPNLRDLGGYRTLDGRQVKWGLLYRSGALDKLDESDQRYLERLQLLRVVDLRSQQEVEDAPDRLPPALLARRIEMPIIAGNIDVRALTSKINSGDVAGLDLNDMLVNANRDFVRKDRQVFRDWLHGLLDEQGAPQLFHCTAGKDRTGFAAAILLLALGVPEQTVMQDYLASNQYLAQKNLRVAEQIKQASQGRTDPALVLPLLGVEARYLDAAFAAMREDYGSVEGFLRDGLGVDEQMRERLREKFLEADAG
jgi:protein-tyrosine phosphatase